MSKYASGVTTDKVFLRTYTSWSKMHQRTTPHWHRAKDYYDRGITVCERWKDFDNFYADMGPRPQGMTLDRIDNSKGYDSQNCRWATLSQQSTNRRMTVWITVGGETLCCAQWSERTGLSKTTICCRIRRYGWNPVDAVTVPVGGKRP